jgi:hypothetical protein
VVVAAALVVATVLLLRSRGDEPVTHAVGTIQAPPDEGPDVIDAAAVRAPLNAAAAELAVQIAGGQPRGLAYAIHTATPWQDIAVLAPELGMAPASLERRPYEGARASVPLAEDRWTWARIADGGVGRSRYLLVPPSALAREASVTFQDHSPVLHVLVLDEDGERPAADANITVHRRDPTSTGLEAVARATSSEIGYARIAVPEAGPYLVCAGALPGEGDPYVTGVVLPEDGPLTEYVCTVVRPGARGTVRLRVDARLGPQQVAFLYLRDANPPGAILPIKARIAAGEQVLTTSLAPGDYELDVLPSGDWRIVGARTVQVAAGAEAELAVRLEAAPRRVTVRLRGVPDRLLPVTVRPLRAGALRGEGERDLFCGTHRWYSFAEQTGEIGEPCRFVVEARSDLWISPQPLRLVGGAVDLDVVPASRLKIAWAANGVRTALVDADGGGWSETVALRARLRASGAGRERVMLGEIVVPQGAVKLRCWDPADGAELWTASVEARGSAVDVKR